MPRPYKKKWSLEQRLQRRLVVCDSTDCWLWSGYTNHDGYGKIRIASRLFFVHRLAYQVWVGAIPEGLYVLHSCHQRACINPLHLRTGTQQENVNDMYAAGRERPLKGEQHGRSKLTAQDVLEIRRLHKTKGLTYTKIASLFSISKTQVGDIIRHKSWSHITEQAAA